MAFRNKGIRFKLTMIVMASSCAALLLACLGFIVNDLFTYREVMLKDSSTRAQIIGNNCTAALSFGDPKPVEEIMAALSADPYLVAACVFDADKKVFAQYRRQGSTDPLPAGPSPTSALFTLSRVHLFTDIVFNGKVIGSVFLQTDLEGLRKRLLRNAAITALVMLGAIGVAFIMTSRLQRVISIPISNLATTAMQVARDKTYSVRAKKYGDDELGHLVDGFNEMLYQIQQRDAALQQAQSELESRVESRTHELSQAVERLNLEIEQRIRSQKELESMQQKLMEISRQAGMAEVATGVLHNVGNVLNSVNVSASLVVEQLRKSKTSSLAKVVDVLREHKDDVGDFLTHDPKGKQLPAFLEALYAQLTREQTVLTKETQDLQKNIEHIKQIVIMQQSFAKVSGALENLAPLELVEDALRMATTGLARHRIEVVRQFEKVPPVMADRHKVLQILINLINNAKQALDSRQEDRRLLLRIVSNESGLVSVEVTDNGAGIPKENLARIFNHGFTTKKSGHGFGLHSGANTAKEMGGSLNVRSDGTGAGATFILELPVMQRVKAAA